MNIHENRLRRSVEAVSSDARQMLDRLDTLQPDVSLHVLQIILGFACTAQHAGSIRAGRTAFEKIPQKWLATHLQEVVGRSLDLADEWNYRRLLELLVNFMPDMFNMYVNVGLSSDSIEIFEVAKDLRARNRSEQ